MMNIRQIEIELQIEILEVILINEVFYIKC